MNKTVYPLIDDRFCGCGCGYLPYIVDSIVGRLFDGSVNLQSSSISRAIISLSKLKSPLGLDMFVEILRKHVPEASSVIEHTLLLM